MVVIAGAEEDVLGYTRVGADGDVLQVENPSTLTYPAVLPDFKFPRPMNLNYRQLAQIQSNLSKKLSVLYNKYVNNQNIPEGMG